MSDDKQRRTDEYERLLDALFIDEPAEEVCRAVEELLQADEDFRRRYVQTQMLRADLEWEAVAPPLPVAAEPAAPRGAARVLHFFARRTPFSITAAAVVIGLLLTALAFLTPPIYRAVIHSSDPPPEAPPQAVARLTGVYEAEWTSSPPETHLLAGRRIELKTGLAELTFRSGARATLEGPAVLVFDAANAATLKRGKLTAVVSPAAVGFAVHTPLASVVDLGTEFGVSVGDDVKVYVYQGEVAVATSDAAGRRVIAAGQSAIINAASSVTLESSLNGKQFVRALPWRPYGGVYNVAAARYGGRVSSCSPSYNNTSDPARAIDQYERREPAGAYRSDRGDLYHSALAAAGNHFEVMFGREYRLQRIEIQGRIDYQGQEHPRHQNLNIELFDSNYNEVWDYVDSIGQPYSGVTTQFDSPPSFGAIDLTDSGLALTDHERTAKYLRITQTQPEYLVLAEVRAIGRVPDADESKSTKPESAKTKQTE